MPIITTDSTTDSFNESSVTMKVSSRNDLEISGDFGMTQYKVKLIYLDGSTEIRNVSASSADEARRVARMLAPESPISFKTNRRTRNRYPTKSSKSLVDVEVLGLIDDVVDSIDAVAELDSSRLLQKGKDIVHKLKDIKDDVVGKDEDTTKRE